MNKEFIPYEQALELKELGFNEPCFGHFLGRELRLLRVKGYKDGVEILAPTFSQAFRWFREKYELHSYIQSDYSWNISGGIWDLNGYKDSRYDWDSESFNTYEEAELECLKQLIEIVKQQK